MTKSSPPFCVPACPLTDLPSTILSLHPTLFLHSLTLHYSPLNPLVLTHSPPPTQLSQLDQETTPRHKQEVQVPVFSPCAFCPVCRCSSAPQGFLADWDLPAATILGQRSCHKERFKTGNREITSGCSIESLQCCSYRNKPFSLLQCLQSISACPSLYWNILLWPMVGEVVIGFI